MELRAIQEPVLYATEVISAHQFSQRSFSQQADSEERNVIQIETALIDLKHDLSKSIDVYELGEMKKAPEK